MHQNICYTFGSASLELENGDLNTQYHAATGLLSGDDTHFQRPMDKYLQGSINKDLMLSNLNRFYPQYIRGQFEGKFPHLSSALVTVFRAPASTAEVETQHKIGKLVLSQRRCRLMNFTYVSRYL